MSGHSGWLSAVTWYVVNLTESMYLPDYFLDALENRLLSSVVIMLYCSFSEDFRWNLTLISGSVCFKYVWNLYFQNTKHFFV